LSERVGFIGLGVMGKPMALNLLRGGHEVVAYTRTAAVLDEVAGEGGERGESPADVASRSDVVITMLPVSAVVSEAVLGPSGVLDGAEPGSLLIDMSTIDPSVSRRLAEEGARRGVGVLDAPVSGGDVGAREGTLSIMVGGEKSAKELPVHETS
jgi:2-hydroxy-3-oxopropionate reductase